MRRILTLTLLLSGCVASLASATSTLCYDIHGVDADALVNIGLTLKLDAKGCRQFSNYQHLSLHYRRSSKKIHEALEPFGYFRSSIHAVLIPEKNRYLARIDINRGPQLKIATINVGVIGPGSDNQAINQFIQRFPLKSGDRFNTVTYEAAKSGLFKSARNQGYIKASFKNKVLIDLERYTAQVTILLDTGPRYYVGSVTFDTHIYADSFMRRVVPFKSSEPFSSERLIKLQQRMEQSYYFQQVIITPDFERAIDYHVPIKISYTVPPDRKYTIGVGYGTLTGPRISAGVSLRRLKNTGEHLEAELKLSSVLKGVNANYYIPGKHPLYDEWLMGGNFKQFSPNSGRSDSTTLTVGYSARHEVIKTNLDLNLLLERFTISKLPTEKAHALYPSFYIAYLNTDSVVVPTNGILLSCKVRAGLNELLSSTSFFQPQVNGKLVYSPFSFAKFIFKGGAGLTTVENLTIFPFSLRYFAGGINSIRGFADSSIGPGRYFVLGSAEYQNRLYHNLNAAVFYDTGSASNQFSKPYNRGAGVGLVYNSFLGPAKLYLAQAISKTTRPYSVEFSLGPEFS